MPYTTRHTLQRRQEALHRQQLQPAPRQQSEGTAEHNRLYVQANRCLLGLLLAFLPSSLPVSHRVLRTEAVPNRYGGPAGSAIKFYHAIHAAGPNCWSCLSTLNVAATMDEMQPLRPYLEAELPTDVDISKLAQKTCGTGTKLYYLPLAQPSTPLSHGASAMTTPRAVRGRRHAPSATTPEMRSLQAELAQLRRQKQQLTERIRKCRLVETYRASTDTKDLVSLHRNWKAVAQQVAA